LFRAPKLLRPHRKTEGPPRKCSASCCCVLLVIFDCCLSISRPCDGDSRCVRCPDGWSAPSAAVTARAGGSANALLRPAAGLSRMRPAALSGLRHSLQRGAGKTRLNAEPSSTRCARRGTRAVQERGALPRAAASPAGRGTWPSADAALSGLRIRPCSLRDPGTPRSLLRITNHESPIPNHPNAKRRPEGSPFCVGALVAGAGF